MPTMLRSRNTGVDGFYSIARATKRFTGAAGYLPNEDYLQLSYDIDTTIHNTIIRLYYYCCCCVIAGLCQKESTR